VNASLTATITLTCQPGAAGSGLYHRSRWALVSWSAGSCVSVCRAWDAFRAILDHQRVPQPLLGLLAGSNGVIAPRVLWPRSDLQWMTEAAMSRVPHLEGNAKR
jgi:hypothetical protein